MSGEPQRYREVRAYCRGLQTGYLLASSEDLASDLARSRAARLLEIIGADNAQSRAIIETAIHDAERAWPGADAATHHSVAACSIVDLIVLGVRRRAA